MSRRGRLCAVVLISTAALLSAPTAALADHCPPIDNPDPVPGSNTTYCHTPRPTPRPATPAPTAAPATPAPTAAPASRAPAPVAPAAPTRTANPATGNTPEPTPFDIEVPEDEDALATPEIIVDGPLDATTDFEVGDAEEAASASTWIFGFIVGFIIGGLIGRASWGLKRRRRQQIFG